MGSNNVTSRPEVLVSWLLVVALLASIGWADSGEPGLSREIKLEPANLYCLSEPDEESCTICCSAYGRLAVLGFTYRAEDSPEVKVDRRCCCVTAN